MNILFIDTETTGTDPYKHSIIQIGAALYVNGELVKSFEIDMKPREDSTISLEALQVNNTTLTELETKLVPSIAIKKFIDFILNLKYYYKGKLFICGHNVHFDLSFLKSLLREYNIEEWEKVASYRVIDTNVLGRFLLDTNILQVPENSPKGSGLKNLALTLGINIEGRKLHTALEDVKLTAEIYYALVNLMKEFTDGRKKVKN